MYQGIHPPVDVRAAQPGPKSGAKTTTYLPLPPFLPPWFGPDHPCDLCLHTSQHKAHKGMRVCDLCREGGVRFTSPSRSLPSGPPLIILPCDPKAATTPNPGSTPCQRTLPPTGRRPTSAGLQGLYLYISFLHPHSFHKKLNIHFYLNTLPVLQSPACHIPVSTL